MLQSGVSAGQSESFVQGTHDPEDAQASPAAFPLHCSSLVQATHVLAVPQAGVGLAHCELEVHWHVSVLVLQVNTPHGASDVQATHSPKKELELLVSQSGVSGVIPHWLEDVHGVHDGGVGVIGVQKGATAMHALFWFDQISCTA